jgi:hypothetical protein
MVYPDDVNILGGSLLIVKKNVEASVVASDKTGTEVNADRTQYMVMSADKKRGQIHSTKIDNVSSERMEKLKYLKKTLTNQNSIQEEFKSRLQSGNVCYPKI